MICLNVQKARCDHIVTYYQITAWNMEPAIMNMLDVSLAHESPQRQNGPTGQSADDTNIERGEYELVKCLQEEQDEMSIFIFKLRVLHH